MAVMKRLLGMKAGNKGKSTRISLSKTERSTYQVVPGLRNNELPEVLAQVSKEVMQEFMPIFEERLKGNLVELDIGSLHDEGDLKGSFKRTITANRNMVRGSLKFNFYGRFVDMGVGKGVTLTERQSGRAISSDRRGLSGRRRPKVWFSKQYAYERQRLTEIMSQNMALLTAAAVGEIEQDTSIKL